MSGILTKNFRLHMAQQFKDQFDGTELDRLFLFIGRSFPWPDETNPPTPVDTISSIDYEGWDSMLAMKRITASDTSFAAPRYNWKTGEVYTPYSFNSPYYNSKFYVLTEDFNVYLCLENNNGAPSTVKPIGTSVDSFVANDGYKWKYLFSVSAADALRFLTQSYIPVKLLTEDDGSGQWAVQQAAKAGAIETLRIIDGGSGYNFFTGSVVSATASVVNLENTASNSTSIYNNYGIYVKSGAGAGQYRRINAYNGATRSVSVNQPFTVVLDSTSVIVITPHISIVDATGVNYLGYCEGTAGTISRIITVNPGVSYSKPVVSVQGINGSGASLVANISSSRGHGANPILDLYAHNVVMNTRLTGTESDTFFIGNEFRKIGIIANPTLNDEDQSEATATVYNLSSTISATAIAGTFNADEIILGQTSGASAYIVNSSDYSKINISPISGTFTVGETIRSNVTTSSATLNSIINPEIKKNSGSILYVENRPPITRSDDQQEDIKFVIKL